MRLQHFLALAGVASRRRSEGLITAGHVSVNGQVVTKLGTKIVPERDVIEVDEKRVEIEKKIYVLLNKPHGYLSTVTDVRGRRTVGDLVSDLSLRLYPVGRLDKDTAGVLLMTNDGALCHRLTHPRFGVDKIYHVRVTGTPSLTALRKLRRGVDIEEATTSPAQVKLIGSQQGRSTLEIIVHEGRKRQIKKMCEAVGYPVVGLTRVEFGGLRVGRLKFGEYRLLSAREVAQLKRKVSLNPK
jgi:pseudouridine synthase